MGGAIDWASLPALCEMHGVDDTDVLIHELAAIRDHFNRKASHGK